MDYLDRSWDSGWRGTAAKNGRGDAFIADRRGDGELMGELKEEASGRSMSYRIHRQEDREAGLGKEAGRSGSRASDDRKKNARSAGKGIGASRVSEDVDAVWHRGSGPRNF